MMTGKWSYPHDGVYAPKKPWMAYVLGGYPGLLFLFAFTATLCFGEVLTVPEKSEIGALFVIDVTIPETAQGPQRLSFEAAVVQYLGPLVFTTEVQNPIEGIVEISKTSPGSQKFSLKFLPLPNTSAATFRCQSGGQPEEKKVSFVVPEAERSYHLPFLILGLVLLFMARYLWNYQKRNPALMSTRSLFMNFEELQKVQESLFPEKPPADSSSSKTTSQELPATPPSPPLPPPPEPPKPPTVPAMDGTFLKGDSPKPSELLSVSAVPTPPQADHHEIPTVTLKSAAIIDTGKVAPGVPPIRAADVIFLRLSDNQGKFFEGSGKEISLGRRKGGTIVFSASEISRNQAIIRHRGPGFVIEALSTTNLTEVNGQKIQKEAPIKTGDSLTMGGTTFRVVELR